MAQPAPQPASLEGFQDRLRFFEQAVRRYGPIIQFPMGPHLTGMLVATANGADRILRTDAQHYPKGQFWKAIGRITGNGLSKLQDHAEWRRQRQLMNPAFSRPSVQQYVEQMHTVMDPMIEQWRAEGAPVDITASSADMAQAMILKILFGSELDQAERDQASAALLTCLAEIYRLQQLGDPTAPISGEAEQAMAVLDSIMFNLTSTYRERLSRGEQPEPHLMGQLIAATDELGSMSHQQLRDELMGSYLAGYETTAIALQWTLYLLAQHPLIAAQLAAEIDTLESQAATYDDLKRLPLLQAVLNESLRLYPPLPYIPRQRTPGEPDVIDGIEVPAGALIFVGVWHIQRDPAHWGADAAEFKPARWMEPAERHRAAFMPFSVGGRICIGEHLSRVAMALGLISIIQRYTYELAEGGDATPITIMTLRPRQNIMMRFSPR